MKVFYITGTGKGIGYSLALEATKQNNTIVYGYSRTNKINHIQYKHIPVDLSNPENAINVSIPNHPDADQVILINNAGILGDVKPTGKIDSYSIAQVFNLNTIAPAILINRIIAEYSGKSIPITIINISSGAGRHPIESWSSYCSSKAAIDMLSEVVQAEYRENVETPVTVFSVAPGIVDTSMQDSIRKVESKNFPHLEQFKNYKSRNLLSSPDEVAQKIMTLINNPSYSVKIDLREI